MPLACAFARMLAAAWIFKVSDGGAPAAASCFRQLEGGDEGRFAQLCVHQVAQGAGALAMDDAHGGDVALEAGFKVIGE